MKYYAVKVGRVPGVYTEHREFLEQINKFPGFKAKAFKDAVSAKNYVENKPYKAKDKKTKYYVVKAGRQPGIYTDYHEFQRQTDGYSGFIGKSFKTLSEAEKYLNSNTTRTSVLVSFLKNDLSLAFCLICLKELFKKLFHLTAKNHYVVVNGRKNGIFYSYQDFEENTRDYPYAKGKKIKSFLVAINYLKEVSKNEANAKSNEIDKKDTNVLCFLDFTNSDKSLHSIQNIKKNLQNGTGVAYVDGSYRKGKDYYGLGVVLFCKSKNGEFQKVKVSNIGIERDAKKIKNQAGELQAVIAAIEEAIGLSLKELRVYYDSTAIVDLIYKSNKNNFIKKYQKTINKSKDELKLTFAKIPAHSGIEFHDEADKLAKKAIEVR